MRIERMIVWVFGAVVLALSGYVLWRYHTDPAALRATARDLL